MLTKGGRQVVPEISTLLNKPLQQKCQQGAGRWSKNLKIWSTQFKIDPYIYSNLIHIFLLKLRQTRAIFHTSVFLLKKYAWDAKKKSYSRLYGLDKNTPLHLFSTQFSQGLTKGQYVMSKCLAEQMKIYVYYFDRGSRIFIQLSKVSHRFTE